ncbi:MFS general substrate transporter [Rhodotorula diobovata]|uniref:MFS general substrate transporter n=1 Tax=Rhodotorula diobovata TaxID=5288 RepID=A0A5C5FVL0_9BASI|nr:MFS general substrate transporter [Rhodotorula diobovata]
MSNDLSKMPSKEQDVFEERDERAAEEAITMSPEDRQRLERKLVRKLDARFSILVIIYILNYIDRNAASSARTKGLEADLGLKGREMDTLLSILYVGYILMQIPSNALVQYTGRPSIVLPVAVLVWGGISTAMGATHSFGPALACRFLLGFVEAAFFPGALMLLAAWYPKTSLGKRFTGLYCGSLISNAFGPLIAAGILANMEGAGGIRAWRWLFYIEGAITMFVALIAYFVLPDFPSAPGWGFSKAEKQLAVQRMTEDVGIKDDTSKISNWAAVKLALTDYKLWLMALALTSMTIGLSFNQFFPQLTKTLGYNNTTSLILCAPPFFFAAIMAFLVSAHSDKTQERFLHIVIPLCFGIVGFIISMTTSSFGPRYFSFFLQAQSYSGFVCFLAWVSSTFARPAMTRSIAIAAVNALSQLGNVTGAYVFPTAWAPSYAKSYAICISTFVFCILLCTVHRFNLARLNRKLAARDEAEANGKEHAGLGPLDFPAGFRYVL